MERSSNKVKKEYSVNVVSTGGDNGDFDDLGRNETQGILLDCLFGPERIFRSSSNSNLRSIDEKSPGPGDYDPFFRSSSPAYSISKSPKARSVSASPGPGDYETSRASTRYPHTFAKSLKNIKNQEVTPGPGDYNTEVSLHTYSSVMIGKPKDENRLNTPGPGSYITETRSFSPAYSIGSSERNEKLEVTPGPSDYLIVDRPHSPSCTIGNAKRILPCEEISNKEKSPGPCDYEKNIKAHSPSAYLIGKPKEKNPDYPGPAKYMTEKMNNYPKASATVIGKSKRPDIVRNNFPGPSDYNIMHHSNTKSCIFSRSKRDFIVKSESPGPKYNIPSTLDHRGGLIMRKIYQKESSSSPGPGAYLSSSSRSLSLSYTIAKAPKLALPKQNLVSPASYSPKPVLSSPRISFPKSERISIFKPKEKVINDNPGPGAYDAIVKNSCTTYSFALSSKETKIITTPGPGEYTPRMMKHQSLSKYSINSRGGSIQDKEYYSKTESFTPYKKGNSKQETESPPKFRSNNYGRLKKNQEIKTIGN